MGPQAKDRSKSSAAITCIKVLLHVFNFLYMIIGASVLGVGIWTEVSLKDYLTLTTLYNVNAPYVMIGVGVLILLVALGGFYCTAKDKVAPLYLYGVFISLLAIVQIGAGIAGGVFSSQLDVRFLDGLQAAIKDTSKNEKLWDKIQQQLQCCGVENASDWLDNHHAIPASCYEGGVTPSPTTVAPVTGKTTANTTPPTTANTTISTTTGNSTINTTAGNMTTATAPPTTSAKMTTAPPTTTSHSPSRKRRDVALPPGPQPYKQGCYSKIKSTMKESLAAIVGVCVGFVALQVLGAVLACCLAKKVNRNNYEQIY